MGKEKLRNYLKQALIEDYSMVSMSRATIIDEVVDEYEKSMDTISIGGENICKIKKLTVEVQGHYVPKPDVSIGISKKEIDKKVNLLAEMFGGKFETFDQQLEIAKRFVDSLNIEPKNVVVEFETTATYDDLTEAYMLTDSKHEGWLEVYSHLRKYFKDGDSLIVTIRKTDENNKT